MMFSKILIANRGEIACRIIRTAKRLGIATVAVYSDADRLALHVRQADEAMYIGPSPATESYLNTEKIIEAAKRSGAEAIHPGYGFLSENPGFVEAIEKAGLVFIGPSAKSIRAMGLKDAAKKLMEKAGVPVVRGYHGDRQEPKFLAEEAEKIGYPVLIKARAGGGGKGMRLVEKSADFEAALEGAQSEGEASFGDGRVLIEKYITSPRHIEVQVFGDNHDNVVHLFERDCSLQRRHQKVIEEAPAPCMTEDMRAAMTNAAVAAAKAINYSGAGTIEFIVDGSKGLRSDGFWFMEMNTRLQVEHPVTEMVTGLDLVEWQLRVASGEKLPATQDQIQLRGHAFEARIYAEDVTKGFLPATGKLEHLKFSDRARNETGVAEGDEISPYYDPMIAKVVTHGDDRATALRSLSQSLGETRIGGLVTNVSFLKALCDHPTFAKGDVETGFIQRELDVLLGDGKPQNHHIALAALIALNLPKDDVLTAYRHWGPATAATKLLNASETIEVQLEMQSNSGVPEIDVSIGDAVIKLQDVVRDDETISASIDGKTTTLDYFKTDNVIGLFANGMRHEFGIVDQLNVAGSDGPSANSIIAPMPGLVKLIKCTERAIVEAGDVLVVLEAMKMEHSLVAPRSGTIEMVAVSEGDQVKDGAVLVTLEESDE